MNLKRSSKPFLGAYNRCYINKKGEYKRLYTNDISYGTTRGLTLFHTIFVIVFTMAVIIAAPTIYGELKHGFTDMYRIIEILFIICFFVFRFLKIMIYDMKVHIEAYNYFKENPHKLNNTQMVVHDICPNCETQNSNLTSCVSCGENLELGDNSINK